MCINS
ncbi:hypothetical protein D039_2386A, partial [Vibrio parahaemolyticus EKP-028]